MEKLKSKAFWEAALVRAIRTFCQTALGCIGGATILGGVDWRFTVSATMLSAIMSVLTSIVTNLPEVEVEDNGVHKDAD